MSHKPVDVFVSSRGNAFMTDIARWIVEAAHQAGRTATLVRDRLPTIDTGAINLVVAPHELFVLDDASDAEVARAAAASIPICTEQPGTPWFNLTAGLIRDAPLVVDINPKGVDAIRARGHEAMHLQLGGVPSMRAAETNRDLDLLFLGGSTPRRGAALASLGPLLWDRNVELRLFRFSAPVDGAAPGTVFGHDKYRLLARSRILLNLHRDDTAPGYFEWARMVEAMANGCAVLTEPSTGFAPLVDGKHFVTADDLASTLAELLDDPNRCREIGEAARTTVLDEHPLVDSLIPILDRLDGVAPGRPRRHRKAPPRTHRAPLFDEFRPATAMRHRVYVALMEEQRLLRHVDRARSAVLHGTDDFVERTTTPSYGDALPEVSVIVTLYNYADVVAETLDSLVASEGVDLEIVIVDDHSRDAGRAVVGRFMDDHLDVPILLLASDVNRGLPASRNLAVSAARAERIMVMDADNTVYPNCLRRLSDALDADPTAAVAYATLEAFGAHPGLRSELGWSPRWLCEANYIDAQAMVRRATYDRHGGYREDDDFAYGWEDWELWLRLAEAGEHGVHVPQMLGRYRTQASSMITITNLVADEMRAHIRGLHPTLPWPEHDRA